MTAPQTEEALEAQLVELMASCTRDPLRFVLLAFDWGRGELRGFDGPDEWQRGVLGDIRDGLLSPTQAIQIAVASGHGIGKSALVAWIVLWSLATMPDSRGIVTANTEAQLKGKTWAELAKWHRLMLCSHWFEFTATAIFSKDKAHEKTWRVDMVPWSETRSEAFAGLHNKGRRLLLVFDEASAIPDIIWEVAEGALTDEGTEIIWCAFGNPTRNKGRFRECWGRFRARWRTRQIDSRTAKMTNKALFDAWIADYGIDSDFVKVRVLGQFPSQDINALLSAADVDAAMARVYTEKDISHAARIIGVDVARQGGDDSVFARRQGVQLFPLTVMHIPDTQLVASKLALEDKHWEGADAVFVDATGGYGVGVVDAYRTMGRACTEVYFSGKATDERYFNKRSEMAFELANWIKAGGALPNDQTLREELLSLTYDYQGDKFRLASKDEIKEELGHSPDRADAAMLTFAYPVRPNRDPYAKARMERATRVTAPRTLDYDPLEVS